jgi:hypothetical protein
VDTPWQEETNNTLVVITLIIICSFYGFTPSTVENPIVNFYGDSFPS